MTHFQGNIHSRSINDNFFSLPLSSISSVAVAAAKVGPTLQAFLVLPWRGVGGDEGVGGGSGGEMLLKQEVPLG